MVPMQISIFIFQVGVDAPRKKKYHYELLTGRCLSSEGSIDSTPSRFAVLLREHAIIHFENSKRGLEVQGSIPAGSNFCR